MERSKNITERSENHTEAALPPGPRPRFPLWTLWQFRRDPIAFLRGVSQKYGDIAAFQVFGAPTYLLSHPDDIRDVLVTNARFFAKGRGLERAQRLLGEGLLTSEGDFHLRQRRLIQPAFHRRRLEGYAEAMTECAVETGQRWQDRQTVDMSAEMMRLTLGVVGRTLFGADVAAEAGEIRAALREAVQVFHLLMLPGAERWEHLPLPAVRRFQAARARLDAVVYRLIAERRASGADNLEDSGDLLSMLLLAQDEDAVRMTDAQVRDEAMTLFLAGHDTTANALSWTWYLLSQNSEAESALHAELAAVLGSKLPTLDDLPRLPYTRAVLSEAIRLYPPAWIIGRRALADYPVRDFVIPQGRIVILAQTVTHVDPRWFPDPLRFHPARWLSEDAEAARPKFAYFPFGGGPRICIGEQFAWMEGILLLATLAARWRASLVPGHPVATEPIITLRPKHGLKMTLERRKPMSFA